MDRYTVDNTHTHTHMAKITSPYQITHSTSASQHTLHSPHTHSPSPLFCRDPHLPFTSFTHLLAVTVVVLAATVDSPPDASVLSVLGAISTVVVEVVVVVLARVMTRDVVATAHLSRVPDATQVPKSLSVQSKHAHASQRLNCFEWETGGDVQQSPPSHEQKALLLSSSQKPNVRGVHTNQYCDIQTHRETHR